MKAIELIVRVIIKREDKILLCKSNAESHYFLPGGHVEFGDSLVDTVYKELNEETGLEKHQIKNVAYKDFLENFYGDDDNKRHELNIIFTANIDEDFEVQSKESQIDFEWVSMSEISNFNLLPKTIVPKL